MALIVLIVLLWLILMASLVVVVKYLSECGGSIEIVLPIIKIKWGLK